MRTINAATSAASSSAARPGDASVDDSVELVDQIMAEFKNFFGEMRCAGTERLLKAGVSMSHLHVMGILARHGDTPMSRLADLLDVSMSNATGLIDRMEERGFVERVRVPDDRRVVLVRITDRGRSTLDEADIVRRDLLARILQRLDPTQRERLALTLIDVREAVAGLLSTEGPELFTAAHPHWHAHGRSSDYPVAADHPHAHPAGRQHDTASTTAH